MLPLMFDLEFLAGTVWPKWGLPCGARTRSGSPCQGLPVHDPQTGKPRNGRCRMHGGASTGPTTELGRARIANSNRRRARA
jgi:hypothetical protein